MDLGSYDSRFRTIGGQNEATIPTSATATAADAA
jgi:hypothetical protein